MEREGANIFLQSIALDGAVVPAMQSENAMMRVAAMR
jgi:hypothetical protein